MRARREAGGGGLFRHKRTLRNGCLVLYKRISSNTEEPCTHLTQLLLSSSSSSLQHVQNFCSCLAEVLGRLRGRGICLVLMADQDGMISSSSSSSSSSMMTERSTLRYSRGGGGHVLVHGSDLRDFGGAGKVRLGGGG